jgi:hypothetical protein
MVLAHGCDRGGIPCSYLFQSMRGLPVASGSAPPDVAANLSWEQWEDRSPQ